MINFEVVQDCSTPIRSDKITLGRIELNLAEYVDKVEIGVDGEDSVVRRYLMQDSKINSTLKVSITMRQIDGDRSYVAPPLKTANMFGGISGIMSGEQEGKDDNGLIPTSIRSREQGEIQNLYRQILAASWVCNDSQLPADECIDDIFNGGNGWSHDSSIKSREQKYYDDEARQTYSNIRRNKSVGSQRSLDMPSPRFVPCSIFHKYDVEQEMSITDRDIQRELGSRNSEVSATGAHSVNGIDENNVRDNLIAWNTWQSPKI